MTTTMRHLHICFEENYIKKINMSEEGAPLAPSSSDEVALKSNDDAQKNCCLSNKFRLANNDATGFLYQVSTTSTCSALLLYPY